MFRLPLGSTAEVERHMAGLGVSPGNLRPLPPGGSPARVWLVPSRPETVLKVVADGDDRVDGHDAASLKAKAHHMQRTRRDLPSLRHRFPTIFNLWSSPGILRGSDALH